MQEELQYTMDIVEEIKRKDAMRRMSNADEKSLKEDDVTLQE